MPGRGLDAELSDAPGGQLVVRTGDCLGDVDPRTFVVRNEDDAGVPYALEPIDEDTALAVPLQPT